jgi:cytochrome b
MLNLLSKSNFFAFVVNFSQLLDVVIAVLMFAVFGLIIFGVAYLILHFLMPFSIRKEIEVDENPALAVIIGALLISIAIIVSTAVRG